MNAHFRFSAFVTAGRLLRLIAVCCLIAAVSACVPKTGPKGAEQKAPVNPDERKAAYGVSMVVPSTWQVQNNAAVQSATKESLDAKRRAGEKTLLLQAVGPVSSKGVQSLVTVELVNQEPGFMPRDYAERLQPHEFEALSKDLLAQDHAEAKKKKSPEYLKDLRMERQNINGNLVIMSRFLIVAPNNIPVYLMHWYVYLPDNAGIFVMAVCDQSAPNAESEVVNIVKTLRVN